MSLRKLPRVLAPRPNLLGLWVGILVGAYLVFTSTLLSQTIGTQQPVSPDSTVRREPRSNVSALVRGAEMRIAETRAVNRALRKAYGIGICSVEELGGKARTVDAPPDQPKFPPSETNGNRNGNGAGCKVRDRLCQIIRQHKLDPVLVKAYAVDFCGTKTLKDATRAQVGDFVLQLAERAEKDRDGLLRQLNSYARPSQEVVA